MQHPPGTRAGPLIDVYQSHRLSRAGTGYRASMSNTPNQPDQPQTSPDAIDEVERRLQEDAERQKQDAKAKPDNGPTRDR